MISICENVDGYGLCRCLWLELDLWVNLVHLNVNGSECCGLLTESRMRMAATLFSHGSCVPAVQYDGNFIARRCGKRTSCRLRVL